MDGSSTTTGDLDALLDDALEGFDQAAQQRGAGVAAGPAPSATDAAACHPEQAWSEAPGPSTSSPAGGGSSGAAAGTGSRGKGLAFDPLCGRPRRAAPAPAAGTGAAATAAPAGRPGGTPGLEGMDVLSEGLSKLLAELAKAEEEGALGSSAEAGQAAATGAAVGVSPGVDSSGAEGGAQQPEQRELHATLRALSDQAPSFAGQPDSAEEMLRLLAEHLGALGGGSAAGGSSEQDRSGVGVGDMAGGAPAEVSSLMDTLMQQLLSKEVLYQPMKDIGDRYPEWLEANKDKLSAEDYQRYQQQQGFIRRICALYETSPADFPQLVDLLQQMQQCGQPPPEIVDELAPGMQFGPNCLPTFGDAGAGEEGLPPELRDCVIQ